MTMAEAGPGRFWSSPSSKPRPVGLLAGLLAMGSFQEARNFDRNRHHRTELLRLRCRPGRRALRRRCRSGIPRQVFDACRGARSAPPKARASSTRADRPSDAAYTAAASPSATVCDYRNIIGSVCKGSSAADPYTARALSRAGYATSCRSGRWRAATPLWRGPSGR